MHRMIHCIKLQEEMKGLSEPPFPGELGKEIYDHISYDAWQMWLEHQTMLINENRLNVTDPKAKAFLMDEMKKFLFGGGSEKPSGYVEPKDN